MVPGLEVCHGARQVAVAESQVQVDLRRGEQRPGERAVAVPMGVAGDGVVQPRQTRVRLDGEQRVLGVGVGDESPQLLPVAGRAEQVDHRLGRADVEGVEMGQGSGDPAADLDEFAEEPVGRFRRRLPGEPPAGTRHVADQCPVQRRTAGGVLDDVRGARGDAAPVGRFELPVGFGEIRGELEGDRPLDAQQRQPAG